MHRTAFVVIAYPAFEDDARTCAGVVEALFLDSWVDAVFGQAEAVHPPDTGGRKTTSSPSVMA